MRKLFEAEALAALALAPFLAADASGKQVTLVEMPGDDHWLSASASRVLVLRQLETFLAANIGPNEHPGAQPSAPH